MNPVGSTLQGRTLPALQDNNFDLLRLVFAMMVCLVHISELSGHPAFDLFSRHLSSALAVKAFFVVSGFLIFMSHERSSSLASYASKRLRRIYPAYLLIIVGGAILLPLLPWAGESAFGPGWLKYVLANALFLNFVQPTLPGVFGELRVHAVNGALWTLKVEVMFYLAVPLIAWAMRRLGRARVIASLYALSIAYAFALGMLAIDTGRGVYLELARQLPGQLSYFMAGACLYYYFDRVMQHLGLLALAALGVLIAGQWLPLAALEPMALGLVVIALAYGVHLGNFSRYGDFSYGVYIVHFPIIQTLLWWGGLNQRPVLFAATVVTATLLTAAVLWHGVEKHFIQRGSHYRCPQQGRRPPSPKGP